MEYYGNNDWRYYYLAHFGIPGMHWGIRRFQPYSVTGPRKGGKTGKEMGLAKRVSKRLGEGVSNVRAKIAKKKADVKRAKALEKARKVKAEKEEIMKSGSAERFFANKEKFTNEEIDKFLERAGKETKIAELRKQQMNAGFDKADEIEAKVKKIAGYMGTANDVISKGTTMVKNVNEIKDLMDVDGKRAMTKAMDKVVKSGDAQLISDNWANFNKEQRNDAYASATKKAQIQKLLGDKNDDKGNKDEFVDVVDQILPRKIGDTVALPKEKNNAAKQIQDVVNTLKTASPQNNSPKPAQQQNNNNSPKPVPKPQPQKWEERKQVQDSADIGKTQLLPLEKRLGLDKPFNEMPGSKNAKDAVNKALKRL